MQKINGPFATPQGEFTEGNPATGTNPTVVTAAWCNAVQRELVNAVLAAGLVLSPLDDTQLAQAIQFLGGSAGGRDRNLLVNGGFEIAQRLKNAGSFAVTNTAQYTLDRWRCHADLEGSGPGAATVTRQTFATGQTDVPGNPRNYLRWVQGTAATAGNPGLEQRVEDVTRFGEGPICFSAYLKGSAALSGTMRIYQVFGTGGSPSAAVLVASQAISISTTWTRFSVAVNLTDQGFSLAGKTLGSNGDSYLRVEITFPSTTSGWTIELANAQLERNGQPTAFVGREPGENLARCRRYFQRTGSLDVPLDQSAILAGSLLSMAANAGNHILMEFSRPFPVAMRKAPTMRWWNPQTGLPDTLSWGGARSVTQTIDTSELVAGRPECATGPGATALAQAHYEADAEL